MPELPEVESVCRSLAPRLVGRTITRVLVARRDIITGESTDAALLVGARIAEIARHGKQFALLAHDRAPALLFHLGMTGSLRHFAPTTPDVPDALAHRRTPDTTAGESPMDAKHRHVLWELDDRSVLVFRDPRRFGGVWTFPSRDALTQRWSTLGPDALRVTPAQLHRALRRTSRAVKAALLDQELIAGLGNIYVDEVLFGVGVHPLTPADAIDRPTADRLAARIRAVLARAIDAGGSTLRDYVNGDGESGGFQLRHRVYGRAGERCLRTHQGRRCPGTIRSIVLLGRTTAFCPQCQPLGEISSSIKEE